MCIHQDVCLLDMVGSLFRERQMPVWISEAEIWIILGILPFVTRSFSVVLDGGFLLARYLDLVVGCGCRSVPGHVIHKCPHFSTVFCSLSTDLGITWSISSKNVKNNRDVRCTSLLNSACLVYRGRLPSNSEG